MVELNDLIQHAREMKPLPASTIRLAALINSPNVDLNEVSEIISYDQALTMRLLRAANSVATGGSARATRASEAVFRLGLARVLSLAIAGSMRDPFQRDVAAYGLAEGELWRHSAIRPTRNTKSSWSTADRPTARSSSFRSLGSRISRC